ncbi:hypothetical protein V6N13_077323 [Hibiscus sabdariffa]|uniref:Cyclin C-terminal domain-containing protein n=1 Tax=Hibiscus sabdariffa TaxID=183260 RepID=A0ABR2CNJ3_9ROSI
MLLQQHKTWAVTLVACSCVSLAAKMMKTSFSLVEFQGDGGLVFDAPTIQRAEYLILGALKWSKSSLKLVEFKPSIIAASALLSASHQHFPLQFPCFRKAISGCSYVNKENMLKCYDSIQEIRGLEEEDDRSMFDTDSSFSWSVNVLEQHLSSSESEITAEKNIKRRRN